MTIVPTIDAATAACSVWDTIVIGAGPAGGLAARQLALMGLRVLLIERRAFPRSKVCGCCLSPRALRVLQDVGLGTSIGDLGGVPLQELQLRSGRRSARLPMSGGIALSRGQLDAALVRSASAAGAAFLPETVAVVEGRSAVDVSTRRVRITTLGQTPRVATARIVLAADGLGHPALVRCGEFHSVVAADGRIGIGATLPGSHLPCGRGTIYMAVGRGGYVGMVQIEGGAIAVAAALDPMVVRDAESSGHAVVALLRQVGWYETDDLQVADWQGTPSLRRRTWPLAGHRLFVVGDAAGYVEPFTGEGITWALSAATEVAPLIRRALDVWEPTLVEEWAALLRHRVWRGQRVCKALAWSVRSPWIVGGAIAALEMFPSLARPILRLLNHLPARLLEGSR